MLNLNGSQLIVEDLLLLAFEKSMSFIKSKSYLTERQRFCCTGKSSTSNQPWAPLYQLLVISLSRCCPATRVT